MQDGLVCIAEKTARPEIGNEPVSFPEPEFDEQAIADELNGRRPEVDVPDDGPDLP